jgi:hypothetical protein
VREMEEVVEVEVIKTFTYGGRTYRPGERAVLPKFIAERAMKYGCAREASAQAQAPAQEAAQAPEIAPVETEEMEVNPQLVAWLQHRGFRKLGEKPVWTKHDKINGQVVRLCVDFQRNPWGTRLAYVLDESTGEWKPSEELRDAEELMLFKRFRDELKKGVEQKLVAKPVEVTTTVETSPGVIAAQKDQQIIVMVEERDEKQILEELMGGVIREYVYQIPGQRPRLSYAGVKEAARLRGNIHVTRIEIEETKDGSMVIAKAEVYDLRHNFKIWGVAQQRKMMRLRDGREVEDEFYLTKVVSKAIRNGLRACIPEGLAAELIARWMKERSGEEAR